jgi:SHS2 domain-containing protein
VRNDLETEPRFLDHTADVGFELEASTLGALLEGALRAFAVLLLGDVPPAGTEARTVDAVGEEPALLLRNLLREVLFLHAASGFVPARAAVSVQERDPDDGVLRASARLVGTEAATSPHTELKGVTLHGLVAERREAGGWYGRVIFDV